MNALESRFQKFHEENPRVFDLFSIYTFQAINAGRLRVGAKAVWERLRWDVTLDTKTSGPKLNNDYTAFYARLFVEKNPNFPRVFHMRKSKADKEKI